MECAICQGTDEVTCHSFWYVRDEEIPGSVQENVKLYEGHAALCAGCMAKRGDRWRRAAPRVALITAGVAFGLVTVIVPILVLNSEPRPSTVELVMASVLLGLSAAPLLGGAVLLGMHLRARSKRVAIDVVADHRERFGVVGCSSLFYGERPSMVTLNGRMYRVM